MVGSLDLVTDVMVARLSLKFDCTAESEAGDAW